MSSQKENMLSGKPFKSLDIELSKEREFAKEVVYKHNNLHPHKYADRYNLLNSLLGKTPKAYYIEQPFYCDYGYNIEIGNKFYANINLTILDSAKVCIGNNVFIGPNCGIYTVAHPIHFEERNKYFEFAHPITIGDNVWIGGSVVINPGVTIGKNSIIGSGSVVTKSIPENVVAVGNPCNVLRAITENDKSGF